MAISFNEVPNTIRVPWMYVEFDSSRAVRGAQAQAYKTLIVGQMISAGDNAGSASPEVPIRVRSKNQADELFGPGSQISQMCAKYFENNTLTETWAIPLEDDVAGVKATGKFVIAGAATAAGIVNLYIGGERVRVSVADEDTASTVATALREAINANLDLPVVASGSSGDVVVTMKNAGVEGNYLDLRINYYDGESLPPGITCAITDMATGAGNPDIEDAIAVFGDDQWHVIIHPYTDESNLVALDEELENRWGPLSQKDGHAFSSANMSYSDLSTFGTGLNSKQLTFAGCTKCPTPPWAVAAAVGGVVAYYGPIDPARPFQTLTLSGVLPPKLEERLTFEERNLLLYDGISTLYVDAGGKVCIERLITTYKTNSAGADDTAFLDVNTKLTLSYLRWDFRNYFLRKYPRHKLADDGTRFGPGQAIITPKIGKAEAMMKFREWEYIGLVENADQFKNDLIVERNQGDPCRLDFLLPPDLVNQMRIGAAQIQFLL